MRICPTCKTAYPRQGNATCPRDGTPLVDAREFAEQRGDPLIGTTLDGRYTIQARIGTGGMGTVYRAQQAGLHREVALKVLKRELVSDRETVARFHREAKAMSMLLHPNTVRVFDFGEDPAGGHLFLAMELLTGELLTNKIDGEGGALDVLDAIDYVREILRSLAEAHEKGIVHRDLKPDNIYLAAIDGHPKPVVKVLDFGIAKVFRGEGKIDQLETQAGTVFGTPRYMSPEQAQGKPLDARSDLYSVGVLLYQLLTGRPPFVDDDAVVVMAKHIRETPDPVRRAAPDRAIPASLERVVAKAMEKDADDRFTTADQFERALAGCVEAVIAEKEARATGRNSVSFGARARELPRAPIVAAAIVLLLAVVVTGALVLLPDEPATALATPQAAAPPPLEPPTAVAAAPAAPVAATSAAPTATHRTVLVDSEPPAAEIWRDGTLLGHAPLTFDVVAGDSSELELRLEGHESERLVLGSAALAQTITLAPERRSPRRGGSGGRSSGGAAATPSTTSEVPEPPAVTPPPRREPSDPYERFD